MSAVVEVHRKPGAGRQMTVRFFAPDAVPALAPSDLKELRQSLNKSFAKFGKILGTAAGRRPFTKQYMSELEKGEHPISDIIARSFWRVALAFDGVDPDVNTHMATVLARGDIEGALVAGEAVTCARPGCPVRFVKRSPRQKYHSAWCREKAKRGQ